MFEVALSRLMCYSRTWRVIRRAVFPSASFEIPIILPGILRLSSSLTAKQPGWGPPKPIGRPNLQTPPTAISAPISAGLFTIVRDRMSEFKTAFTPCSFSLEKRLVQLVKLPKLSGFQQIKPQYSFASYHGKSAMGPITTSTPFPSVLVLITSIICGNIVSDT